MPRYQRFLSSLHGGRAHPHDHPDPARAAAIERSGRQTLRRTSLRAGESRHLVFRFALSRCGKGHAWRGSRGRFAPPLRGRDGADREMVRFLIGRHLALSETINSRDLEDPAVIEALAHSLGTVERLKALTLLTYGDISAVNPGAMTPWRRSQLWRLYMLTYNELTRELDAERIEPRPADSPKKAAFLEGFPT